MKYKIGDKIYIITKWGRKEYTITDSWVYNSYFGNENWYSLGNGLICREDDIDGIVEN